MALLLLAVPRWWQAAVQARTKKPCISRNKARPRSMEQGLLNQALLCATLLCAAALPWRETRPAASEGRHSSVNKVHLLIFFRRVIHIEFLLLLLACCGGEEDKDWSSVVRVDGRLLALGACFVRLKLYISEFPSGRSLASPLPMVDGATPAAGVIPGIYFLQADVPLRRIFPDPGMGLIASAAPSGKFPGGNAGSCARWSSKRGGEDDGLDCFLQLSSRVFSVKVLALSAVFLACRGFTVTCTHRFD